MQSILLVSNIHPAALLQVPQQGLQNRLNLHLLHIFQAHYNN